MLGLPLHPAAEAERFNNIASILLLLPLMTAPALASLMWKLMTNPNFGILSYFVSLLGVHDFKMGVRPSTALLTVVLVDIWVYTPFIMILLLAGLSHCRNALRSRST
jgi:multiple sugar transport system permease protein